MSRSTPLTWRKSSRSGGGNGNADCVQVASTPEEGGFGDSKLGPEGTQLWFPLANALAFTAAVHAGQFDPPA